MLIASLVIIRFPLALLCGSTWIAAAQPLSFEVAVVKPHRDLAEGRDPHDMDSVPGRITMRNVNLAECIEWAWNVRDYQLFGPAFLRQDKFDVEAKAPGATSLSNMRQMFQTLLGERFHVQVHRDTKELSIYELGVAKGGPKLHNAQPDEHTDMRVNNGAFEFRNTSMQQFADDLSGLAPVARPVLDRTALPSAYDFNLKMAEDTAEMKRTFMAGDGLSIFTVIQEQLGLRLEAKKASIDILIVDHADKFPAEN